MTAQTICLSGLSCPAKILLTAFLALIGVGYLTAGLNIVEHHQEAQQCCKSEPIDLLTNGREHHETPPSVGRGSLSAAPGFVPYFDPLMRRSTANF